MTDRSTFGDSKTRHKVENKDTEALTGICQRCGPVKLVARYGKKYKGKIYIDYKCEVADREHVAASNYKRYYGNQYGMTPLQASNFIFNKVCAICLGTHRLCIDHCHRTGRIRGVLCTTCNATLGMAKDRVDILLRAIQYLEGALPVAWAEIQVPGEVTYVRNASNKGSWPGSDL